MKFIKVEANNFTSHNLTLNCSDQAYTVVLFKVSIKRKQKFMQTRLTAISLSATVVNA